MIRTCFLSILCLTCTDSKILMSMQPTQNTSTAITAHINNLAALASAQELAKACKENPHAINTSAPCENGPLDIHATPLCFAVLSDYEPEKKIACLKFYGAKLDTADMADQYNAFNIAVTRHEDECSAKTRAIILTLIRTYPQTLNVIDRKGFTILLRAARMVDEELIAKLINNNKKSPDVTFIENVPSALTIARTTEYTYRYSGLVRPFESFFCKNLFESKKQDCISLLEDALKGVRTS